ncbi:RNA-directed DNA polymerase from mobile element jockey [Araneus ventricosus]|uniref:RNA-directed DNA polymerase from mobile element jockey n=1 Tax=Araneus ventricosus TaxID=182803 RepID=A0A4Y2QRX8_ARAVE|nr:RNA-directed DNA polymerase from mobile element jockey [Araneus ventricosus]
MKSKNSPRTGKSSRNIYCQLTPPTPPPNTKKEIETEVNELTALIIEAHAKTGKWVTEKPDIYSEAIRTQKETRNRLRRVWQRSRHPEDKRNFNRAHNSLKKLYQIRDNRNYTNEITSLSPQDGSVWKHIKRITRVNQKMPPLLTENDIAYTNEDKANEIANSLEKQFKNNDLSHPPTECIVREKVRKFKKSPITTPIIPCKASEVFENICKIKNNKSPGIDKVSNNMLKRLPLKTILRLTELINAILKRQYFPKAWKTAIIVPIPKPGKNPQKADSYRPISLLSTISKLTEAIILKRLTSITEEKLVPFQFGFRKKLSTTDQLLRMTEIIRDNLENGRDTGAVFIDIAKAFDRVWLEGLIYKMLVMSIPDGLIKLMNSYLHGRGFTVRVGNSFSSGRSIEAGVVQGSKLGPQCFSIFVNDITRNQETLLCMYADDTAIMSTGVSQQEITDNLNSYLAELGRWLIKWKIKVNVDKSQAVYFTRKRSTPPPPKLYRRPIPWSNKTVYLGVEIDKTLTYKNHIDKIRNKFKTAKQKLYPLLGKHSKLSLDNKLLTYKSLLRPIITYASPVWGAAAKTHLKKLESLQNAIARQITNSPWYFRNKNILKDLKLQTIAEHTLKIAKTFFRKIDNSNNAAIQSIPDYDPASPRKKRRARSQLLR